MIKTSTRQPTAPIERGPAPVHECDRLAAHETDKDAVTRAVDFSDINAGAVISTCTAAFRQRPDTSRFLTQLGSGQMKAGQRNQAFVTFSKAARMGSAQSMAFLAIMHKNGWGTQKSLSEALHWFDKAAQNGNASGMVFAASMYFHGQGTSRNYNRAAKWYQAAVNEGYPEAMFSLSNLYDNGQGVRRDSGRAANLMLLAFKRGHKGAQDALISNSRNMSVEMRRGIQNLLASKGIYNGPIDGKFGSGTTRALRTFAKRKN